MEKHLHIIKDLMCVVSDFVSQAQKDKDFFNNLKFYPTRGGDRPVALINLGDYEVGVVRVSSSLYHVVIEKNNLPDSSYTAFFVYPIGKQLEILFAIREKQILDYSCTWYYLTTNVPSS